MNKNIRLYVCKKVEFVLKRYVIKFIQSNITIWFWSNHVHAITRTNKFLSSAQIKCINITTSAASITVLTCPKRVMEKNFSFLVTWTSLDSIIHASCNKKGFYWCSLHYCKPQIFDHATAICLFGSDVKIQTSYQNKHLQ